MFEERYRQLEQILIPVSYSLAHIHDWAETAHAELGGYPRDLLIDDPERVFAYARQVAARRKKRHDEEQQVFTERIDRLVEILKLVWPFEHIKHWADLGHRELGWLAPREALMTDPERVYDLARKLVADRLKRD
jgi:hypothetical protein